ncbi:glycogen-binding domain-containing protein [Balneolales bacterium ANBcel1]|nr:glycogen-binding domain-containing protein [Balneolales bacterium ANBcel1]
MSGLILISSLSAAQRLETGLTLSAHGGYSTNLYLVPQMADWSRTEPMGFTSLRPAGYLLLTSAGRSLSINAAGQLIHLTGDHPDRASVLLSTRFRQRVSSGFSLAGSGGLHVYSASQQYYSQTRNMQWLQAEAEWFFNPFTKMEVTGGSARRSFMVPGLDTDQSSRYDFYGIGLEYWPGFRWRLRTDFRSSPAHITNPGDGFSTSFSVSRFTGNGAMFLLQTGLEQYSTEFQDAAGSGTASPNTNFQSGLSGSEPIYPTHAATSTDTPVIQGHSFFDFSGNDPTAEETITLSDRIHRTTLQVTWPLGNQIIMIGTVSGLFWFTSEDHRAKADYHASAGVRVPFSIRRPARGTLRTLTWETSNRDETVLTVRYRGEQVLYLTGSFNDWEDPGIPLRRTGRNRYSTRLDLPPGAYEYKIGRRTSDRLEWVELPEQTPTVQDGFGGTNGMIFIDY